MKNIEAEALNAYEETMYHREYRSKLQQAFDGTYSAYTSNQLVLGGYNAYATGAYAESDTSNLSGRRPSNDDITITKPSRKRNRAFVSGNKSSEYFNSEIRNVDI